MSKLSESLRDAVRKLARTTTVEQLRKRGVRRVNVLGVDRVVGLIEEAVDRSLRHRLLGFERAEVADATREEFLRLLRENETLSKDRADLLAKKSELEDSVSELRLELQRQEQALEARLADAEKLTRARTEGENEVILEAINELVRGAGGGAELADRLGGFVLGLVDEQRRIAREAQATANDDEIDRLRRRIGKLSDALDGSEAKLAELASGRAIDDGIASIYRDVQGLSGTEADFKRKKELMTDIFKANVQLQKKGVPSA